VQDHGWNNQYHLDQNGGNWLRKTPLRRDLDDEVARQLDQFAASLDRVAAQAGSLPGGRMRL
jgi:hypothetical protein